MPATKDLVRQIAKQSGHSQKVVSAVLKAVPQSLWDILEEDGSKVRTPLGVFRRQVRKARRVKSLSGSGWSEVPADDVIKLKPGKALKGKWQEEGE